MKKEIVVFMFLINIFSSVFATEDPEIRIIDVFLGSTKTQIFIYQDVFNYGGYLTNLMTEKFILVKEVIDGKLVLKSQQKIESNKDIINIFEIPDFKIAVPENLPSKYMQLYSSNNDKIFYVGSEINVYDIIPKELWQYKIDKIECSYRFNDHVLIILDIVSKTEVEYLRKVILLK